MPHPKACALAACALAAACAAHLAAAAPATQEPTLEVETSEVRAVPLGAAPRRQMLIDTMDVYSLSKYASLLRRSHMVSLPYIAGEGSLRAALSDLLPRIKDAAMSAGLPPALVQAVAETESGLIAGAVSQKGAQGLMQLMPQTASELGVADPFDPDENLRAGARYLMSMISRFGALELALAAYNAGPGAVERAGGIPDYPETASFVSKVMSRYAALNQGAKPR